jgi:transcriptional regulator with XRE-family HTH domain
MSLSEEFRKSLEESKKDPDYQIERLLLEINEKILEILEGKGLTKKAFAEKLGVSSAYITKLLNGRPNLTLKSLIKIALTLNVKLKVEIRDYAKVYKVEIPIDSSYKRTQIPLELIETTSYKGKLREAIAA